MHPTAATRSGASLARNTHRHCTLTLCASMGQLYPSREILPCVLPDCTTGDSWKETCHCNDKGRNPKRGQRHLWMDDALVALHRRPAGVPLCWPSSWRPCSSVPAVTAVWIDSMHDFNSAGAEEWDQAAQVCARTGTGPSHTHETTQHEVDFKNHMQSAARRYDMDQGLRWRPVKAATPRISSSEATWPRACLTVLNSGSAPFID